MKEKEMEKYTDIMRKCGVNTEKFTWGGLENIAKAMEEYHQAKLKLLGAADVSARLSASLGKCIEGNDYEIVADKDGRFWINHKEVGSGEPLEQWINSVLTM